MSQFQNGPFDVSADDLARVTPEQAVEIVKQLLVAEAIEIGIPATGVDVSSAITTPDGGVDAVVSLVDRPRMTGGLLREGHVRYQIKSGSFSASNESELKSLVFRPGTPAAAENLNHRVKACLDANGTFIAVLFGAELTGTKEGYGETELKTLLSGVGYPNAKVEILRANQLGTAIKVLAPALALQINGISSPDGAPLFWLEHLEKSVGLLPSKFIDTETRRPHIAAIKQLANNLKGFRHVRIIGDPGSGKTHLAYEAVANSLSKGLVLYTESPDKMVESTLMGRLIATSKAGHIILIADDCDLQIAMRLEEKLKNVAKHFLLITIFGELGKDSMLDAQRVDVKPLESEALQDIFAGYEIPKEKQTWLADLCQGSPRAAHAIGWLVSNNPDVDYADHFPKLDNIWESVVTSPDGPRSPDGKIKLTVARCIALFRKVAWGSIHGESGRAAIDKVIALVSKYDATTVNDAIQSLYNGRILQGSSTLFITPKLLHIKLWCDWWDAFEYLVTDEWLKTAFEGNMQEWFNEMFVYAHESKAARKVVEQMLAPDGRYSKLEYFSQAGQSILFFALAQAEPKAALRRLKATLGQATQEELLAFHDGRREVVNGLEIMAVPAATFLDAAECLLLLAEAENETWSNNATGVFVSLFSLGYDKLAASELAPIEKVPFLRRLLTSKNSCHRALAIQALGESLQAYISRTDVGDAMGLRQLPDRWTPKSADELAEAFRQHIELLAVAVPNLEGKQKTEAAAGIISNTRSLILIPKVASRVLDLLHEFAMDLGMRSAVTEVVEAALHYEKNAITPEIIGRLEELRHELTQQSFHDKLARYAGLQLTEDSFDENGNYRTGPHPALEELRDVALVDATHLEPEMYWLHTEAAKNGFMYGHLLGESDGLRLWPTIRDTWLTMSGEVRTDFFIGGYLSGLFDENPEAWEREILQLLSNPEPATEVLRIVWRSGMTATVAEALLEECREGNIQPRDFNILVYGAKVKEVPFSVFREIMGMLLESEDHVDAETALNILQSRKRSNVDDQKPILDLLQLTLEHSTFVSGFPAGERPNNMRDWHWADSAKDLLEVRPEAALALGIRCIEHFGETGSITAAFYSHSLEFFDALLTRFPNQVWGAVSEKLDGGLNSLSYRLLKWLRGQLNNGILEKTSGFELMDTTMVMDWINAAPDTRAPLIAQYCPPAITKAGETPSLARLILEQYGDQPNVPGPLHSNLMTAFFSGPASEYYQRRGNSMKELLAAETDANVRRWLEREVEYLENVVEQEKAREEAQGF